MTRRIFALSTLLALFLATNTFADFVYSPVAVTQNTLGVAASIPQESLDFVYDGSGLPPFDSGSTDFESFAASNPAHDPFAIGNAWASQEKTTTGVIDFDLGQKLIVSSVAIWNQADDAEQGIQSFDLFFADDEDFSSATLAGSFNATDDDRFIQTFDFGPNSGRYARLQINSNHGDNNFTTLGEIVFNASPIPEPTCVFLLIPTALCCLNRRTSKR